MRLLPLVLVWLALAPSLAAADAPGRSTSRDAAPATTFTIVPGEYGWGHRTCERRPSDGHVRCVRGRLRSRFYARGRLSGGSVLSAAGLGLFGLSGVYLYNTRHEEDGCHNFFCTPGSTIISFLPAALISFAGAFHLGRGGKALVDRRDILRSLTLVPWVDSIRPPIGSRTSSASLGLLLGGSF